MKIGELSQKTGLKASAIRFYEERGLLQPAERGNNGYRQYTASALQRLHMVRAAQALGFSLGTIRGFFTDDGECAKGRTLSEIEIRMREVDEQQAALAAQRMHLLELRAMLEQSVTDGTPAVCLFDDVQ
jgi:DNA-binding transcriptional MerR regulator